MQLEHQRKNACGHFHIEPVRAIFSVMMTNAGGEGKTTLALVKIALCCLEKEAVRVLDADIGNWSMRQHVDTAKVLGWGVKTIKAEEIADDARGAHQVLDLGANALASATEMTAMVPALQSEFAARGYLTIAFFPVSTNKIGATGAAAELARNMDGFTKIFVKVDRDGSTAFDAEIEEPNVIQLDHLQTGFQQYFKGPGGGLVNAILDPPDGYREASRHVAQWLRSFAAQEPIATLFPEALRVLTGIPQPAGRLRFTVPNLDDVTDENLTKLAQRSEIFELLDRHGWTGAGLRKAADIVSAAD